MNIKGLLKEPRRTASGNTYQGRFTCQEVQWTGEFPDALATFTITAQELADAADNNLIWTDQDVQRGVKPEAQKGAPRELSLAAGYPDSETYIFDGKNADDMVEKLLGGELLFLNPLIWNLRPGHFEAFQDKETRNIFLYSGKIYLPDSHHRHQAIIKAVRVYREAKSSFPSFALDKEFTIQLYFLSQEDEGNYFFDKNQRPKPTERSKAYDLTTVDDLSILAKDVINKSLALRDNVNRVTDSLTGRNPQVVTLSTVREMMKTLADAHELDKAELDGLSIIAARFYDLLASIRPELGHVEISERRIIRKELVVDAAVMMYGYAALMREFNTTISKLGLGSAEDAWTQRLKRFGPNNTYTLGFWRGDLFDKANPLWQALGIVKPSKDGSKLTVTNTGGTRAAAGRALRVLAMSEPPQFDLAFLISL